LHCDLLSINPGFEKPIKDLWNCLETCKLPENAAKDWFIDLADKKICVCGREINAFESKQIKDHADNFLSGNHQNQLNQIKESIRDFCDGPKDIDEPSENIQGKLDKSAKSYADGRTHRDEANRLKGLAAKELDTTARRAEIINELATFGQEKLDLEDNVKILGDIKTELGSIAWAENEETLAKDDFRSHKKMYSLYAKSELLKDLFEYLENHVLMKICKGIVVRTNKSISNMIGNKTMNIREIGADRLILESGSPKGSKGQNLALGYSFLEAVYSPMDFSLPLIIDSPFGKIDSFIRPDIAKMLWKLDRQMIILLIDTEKEAFLPKIKELAKKDKKENKIEYITQFNITDKTKHVAGKLSGANLVSGNDPESYLTKNEKAFEEFMNLGEFDPVEVKN